MTVYISVTKGDIIHGRRQNCTDCAVARAIKRAVGGDAIVTVTRDEAHVNGVPYPLPDYVGAAVTAIDSGWRNLVRPFEFSIEMVEQQQVAA